MKNLIRQNWIAFKSTYGFLNMESFLFIKLINPFFQLLFFVLLATFSGSNKQLPVVVIGNAMLLCSFTSIGDLGMIYNRERFFGTLKSIVASNRNRVLIFFEKGSFQIIDAFLTAVYGLMIGYVVFQIPIFDYPLFEILFMILVSMLGCVGLGFLLGSICLVFTDINLLFNILSMSMVFLCGANISIELLPQPLLFLSYCLPVTRGLQAITKLMNGATLWNVSNLLIEELLLGIFLFLLSIAIFHLLEQQARKRATIDLL